MARKYDIIERLKAKNERPFIMIDEDHSYKVETSKTNVMSIMAYVDEMDKKENSTEEDDMKMMDEIIKMALGKEALEYITSLNLALDAYMLIFDVIIAAVNGEELKDDSEKQETSKK